MRHLLGNAAGLFSVEKFYAALKSQGLSISKDTVHQLLGHLKDCFLVRTVWRIPPAPDPAAFSFQEGEFSPLFSFLEGEIGAVGGD